MVRFDPTQNLSDVGTPGSPVLLTPWQKTLRDCVPCPHVAEQGPHAAEPYEYRQGGKEQAISEAGSPGHFDLSTNVPSVVQFLHKQTYDVIHFLSQHTTSADRAMTSLTLCVS